jgi:hypothetical protein
MKHDGDEATSEDIGDDEGSTLKHQVVGATEGTSHDGTRERKT